MAKTYKELKEELDKPVQDHISKYAFWAFGEKQLNEKLTELGITKEELQQNYVSFFGGAMRADKVKEYRQLADNSINKMIEALKANYELAKDAFNYEMNNHECFYTSRFSDALNAIGITMQEVQADETLKRAYTDAKKAYWDWACDNC